MAKLAEIFYTEQTAPLAQAWLRKHNIPSTVVRIKGHPGKYGLHVPNEHYNDANELLPKGPSFTGQPLSLLKKKRPQPKWVRYVAKPVLICGYLYIGLVLSMIIWNQLHPAAH